MSKKTRQNRAKRHPHRSTGAPYQLKPELPIVDPKLCVVDPNIAAASMPEIKTLWQLKPTASDEYVVIISAIADEHRHLDGDAIAIKKLDNGLQLSLLSLAAFAKFSDEVAGEFLCEESVPPNMVVRERHAYWYTNNQPQEPEEGFDDLPE
jgi:hypothetical protein